jgi:tetratricopeptide (TPR) repeat protein
VRRTFSPLASPFHSRFGLKEFTRHARTVSLSRPDRRGTGRTLHGRAEGRIVCRRCKGRGEDRCNYYNAWGDAFVKNKMFDQAIKTFTAALTASNIAESNCRHLLQPRAEAYAAAEDLRNALADYTALWEKTEECCREKLSVKRAKLHLRLNEPEEAVAILEDVFGRPGGVSCPQPYLLRAEAYRLLGNTEGASADERRARELGSPSYCVGF